MGSVIALRFGEVAVVTLATSLKNDAPHTSPRPYDSGRDGLVIGEGGGMLVRVEDNLITVRPIAGTRPRGATEEADLALEEDLLSSKAWATHSPRILIPK